MGSHALLASASEAHVGDGSSDGRLEDSTASGHPPKGVFDRRQGAASWVLRELQPRRWINLHASPSKNGAEARAKYGFDVDEMERVLPDVVRSAAGGQKQISYQDIIALVTQAAKERKQQLDMHQAREVVEITEIHTQQTMIEELETQLKTMRSQFRKLRQKTWAPPIASVS